MKKLIGFLLFGLLLGACAQVDQDTYKEIGSTYGRSDGWFSDSSYNSYLMVNGSSVMTIDSSGGLDLTGGDITMQNDATISNSTNNAITFGENSEDLSVTFGTNLATFSSSTGATVAITPALEATGGLDVVAATLPVKFADFRVYDNFDALLDQTAADDDDLTLVQGTPGTNATTIETVDCGGLADTTQKGAFWIEIPHWYKAGSTITLTTNVGMVTTVADQSATLDYSCWVPDYANADATVSGDLITTEAQSVNSTTFADKDFVIDDDASGYEISAGDVIQCQVTALCDDDLNGGDGITIRINKITVVISA